MTWPSIPAMVREAGARDPGRLAVVDGDRRVTYAQLVALVRDGARGLVAAGVEPGDRVAMWAPNSLDFVAAALAITTAGGVMVPVSTRFKGTEAAYILGRSRARVLFTTRGFLDTDYPALLAASGESLPALEHVVLLTGTPADDLAGHEVTWDAFVAAGTGVTDAEIDARIDAVAPSDPADIFFTSGTTGAPKGVVMAHEQVLRAYLDWCDWADLRPGDRYLAANPFFHIFGYKAGICASMMRGATLYPVAVFDAAAALELVERERITMFPGPPTVYQMLLDHPDRATRDISSVRVAVTGGADIPVELIRRMQAEMPFGRILTGYGLTEAGTLTGSQPGDDADLVATTVGVVWPGFEVRVVDEHNAPVAVGEAGEVCARGDTVMRAYFEDDDATAAAFDDEGFLHTGDLGVFDADGYLRIVGRIKDMFLVGGFNAYPAEIENLLLRHPAIAQVSVIGIPDARLGEVGMAFVVRTPGAEATADEIIAWARDEMANFKVPRRIAFVDALPLNATGKVVKDELRAMAQAEMEQEGATA